MILAAGWGSRMRPLTDKTPKPLLKVAGKTLLQHQIERLRGFGCKSIVINCAYMGQQIQKLFGSGRELGVRIRYSDEGDSPVGTAVGVRMALPLLGERPFWLVSCDALCDYPQLQPPQGDDLARVLLVENPPHNSQGDFFLQRDRLSLDKGERRLTYSGIGCYKPQFFQPRVVELGELLATAASGDRVGASLHIGYWTDVGTVERLAQAEKMIQGRLADT
ncbi:MAG: nucleotidyltransferase family protein [Candidatus Porifericomitaceae bacterium WSBS_2022_MAG_OTU9]